MLASRGEQSHTKRHRQSRFAGQNGWQRCGLVLCLAATGTMVT
eukprot:SAG31_NODE_37160_length_306_cov_1.492754_1_plen_42_part_01